MDCDNGQSNAPAHVQWPAAMPASAQFLSLARGFTLIFWGTLTMVGLFLCQGMVEIFHLVRVPAYVAGVALIAFGLVMLQKVQRDIMIWQQRIRRALVLSGLALYFAPFINWWLSMPEVTLFLVNVLGLLLACMVILVMLNILAANVLGRFQERGCQIEAQLYAAAVIGLMILPFLLGVLFALVAAIRYEARFAEEVWLMITRIPIWVYVFATVPCSLTLVALWKTRSLCYRAYRVTLRDNTGM
jgi:hypothetical protein